MTITLPRPATVLTLVGLNFDRPDYMPDQLRGLFKSPGYTLRKVDYPASVALNSISSGVSALNEAVLTTPGQKIVFAHSQGAQVCTRWIRKYMLDPASPSIDELMFVLIGNPLRNPTGRIIGRTEVGLTKGLPTPLGPWPIIDIARRWDGWAIDSESERSRLGRIFDHPNYRNVNLFSAVNTVAAKGSTTFVIAP
jgi:hypothetical protein